jgi:hypothetical protein
MGLSNNLSLLKDIETQEVLPWPNKDIEPNALAKPKIKKKYFAFAELD